MIETLLKSTACIAQLSACIQSPVYSHHRQHERKTNPSVANKRVAAEPLRRSVARPARPVRSIHYRMTNESNNFQMV